MPILDAPAKGKPRHFTAFEECELSARLLLAHLERKGLVARIQSPSSADHDRRPRLAISLDLMGRLGKSARKLEGRVFQDWEIAKLSGAWRPLALEAEGREGRRYRVRLRRLAKEFEQALTRARDLLDSPQIDANELDFLEIWTVDRLDRFLKAPLHRINKRHSNYSRILGSIAVEVQNRCYDRGSGRHVGRLAYQLFHLTELVEYTRQRIEAASPRHLIVLLFVECYHLVRKLFRNMEDARRIVLTDEALKGLFVRCAAALKMEAAKAFKGELRELDREPEGAVFTERAYRAASILANGFEQAFREVAELLEPRCDIDRLFTDPILMHTETVELLKHLEELRVAAMKAERDERETTAFLGVFFKFRNELFPSLFQRDRRPFKAFEAELLDQRGGSRVFVLHRFQIFLSTLTQQVRHRSALQIEGAASREGA